MTNNLTIKPKKRAETIKFALQEKSSATASVKASSFTYGDIKLDKINSSHALVPSSAIEVTLPKQDKTALAIAIRDNLSALLVGETGTGKSSVIKELAYKRQQPYVRVNMNGYTTPDELVGRMAVKDGATYFEDGVITHAMKLGAILVLDEVNGTTQDCLFVLHGLLDDDKQITLPNGDVIKPHPDFRVFATCNPDYEGTKTMNKAFIDRFGIILTIDVLSAIKEKELLVKRTGIDEEKAQQLVTMATMARKDYSENKLSTYISTRALVGIAKLIVSGMDFKEAYKVAIMRKTTDKQEQKALYDFCLAVLKFADDDSASNNMPVVTTKGELQRYQDNAKAWQERAIVDQRQRMEAMKELTIAKNELTTAESNLNNHLIVVEKLQAEKKELEEQVKAYAKLDEIINTVSKAKNSSGMSAKTIETLTEMKHKATDNDNDNDTVVIEAVITPESDVKKLEKIIDQ